MAQAKTWQQVGRATSLGHTCWGLNIFSACKFYHSPPMSNNGADGIAGFWYTIAFDFPPWQKLSCDPAFVGLGCFVVQWFDVHLTFLRGVTTPSISGSSFWGVHC